jgi:hypothetical protein
MQYSAIIQQDDSAVRLPRAARFKTETAARFFILKGFS